MAEPVNNPIAEILKTRGLLRLVLIYRNAEPFIDILSEAAIASGAKQTIQCLYRTGKLEFTNASEDELASVNQFFFADWRCRDPECKNAEELDFWKEQMALHPEWFWVPGLDEELVEFTKVLFASLAEKYPEGAKELGKKLAPGSTLEDFLALFWLADSVPSRAIPPGHNLFRALGVNDKGAWDSLPEEEQISNIFDLCLDSPRFDAWARTLFRVVHHAADKGTSNSVSDRNTIPLQVQIDDPRWKGWTSYQMDEETGEARIEVESPTATRFVSELEDRDEAEVALDRMAAEAHLSASEHIILAGLRKDLGGTELEDYAVQHGIARKSVPVLKSRLITKLKRAASLTLE